MKRGPSVAFLERSAVQGDGSDCMKILLTGGSGFVGRTLKSALEGEHEVIAPSHAALDVCDTAAVDAFLEGGLFDVIVHAAIQGGERVVETTLRGYGNLARWSDRVARMFYFGSGAEYGKHRELAKVKEEDVGRVVPKDPYGLAKLWLSDHARRSRGRIVNLRLFGAYGVFEGYLFRFISNSIVKALLDLELVVRQDVVFDYLWADDLAVVLKRLLEKSGEIPDLNVTPTESISLRRILQIIERASKKKVDVTFLNEGLNFEYTGDNRRLCTLLPDLEFTPYEVGIPALYAHYDAGRDTLDEDAVRKDDYLARCRPKPAAAI